MQEKDANILTMCMSHIEFRCMHAGQLQGKKNNPKTQLKTKHTRCWGTSYFRTHFVSARVQKTFPSVATKELSWSTGQKLCYKSLASSFHRMYCNASSWHTFSGSVF